MRRLSNILKPKKRSYYTTKLGSP